MTSHSSHESSEFAPFWHLVDAAIDGRLTASEADQLDHLLISNDRFREKYLEAVDLHAALILGEATDEQEKPCTSISRSLAAGHGRPWYRWSSVMAALSVLLFTAGFLLGNVTPQPSLLLRTSTREAVATLVDSKLCSWGPTDTATRISSRLFPGTMRLNSGLATLRFDHGMEVTLEGGTVFFARTKDSCLMSSGTILCDGSQSSSPFTIDCKDVRIELQNAKIAVAVRSHQQEISVDILAGSALIEHRRTHERVQIQASQIAIAQLSGLIVMERPVSEVGERWDPSWSSSEEPPADVTLSTNAGQGEDAFVMHSPIELIDRPQLLLVKHSEDDAIYRRKAYIKFDLSEAELLSGEKLAQAELVLTVQISGLGYAAETPDSEFEVYGLEAEEKDYWHRESLTWENAPANDDAGDRVDPNETRLLGSFIVPQGMQRGNVTLKGAELAHFIAADTNGLITLIIVRKTPAHQAGMVHAFGSRRLSAAAAPRLRLWSKPNDQH